MIAPATAGQTPLTDAAVAKNCRFHAPIAVNAAQAVAPYQQETVTVAMSLEPTVPASFARDLERALTAAKAELVRRNKLATPAEFALEENRRLRAELAEKAEDAARLQLLCDASGQFYEEGYAHHMIGRLREYIDSEKAAIQAARKESHERI